MEFKKTGKGRTFGGKDRSEGRGVSRFIKGSRQKKIIFLADI